MNGVVIDYDRKGCVLTVDTIESDVEQVYRIHWKPSQICPSSEFCKNAMAPVVGRWIRFMPLNHGRGTFLSFAEEAMTKRDGDMAPSPRFLRGRIVSVFRRYTVVQTDDPQLLLAVPVEGDVTEMAQRCRGDAVAVSWSGSVLNANGLHLASLPTDATTDTEDLNPQPQLPMAMALPAEVMEAPPKKGGEPDTSTAVCASPSTCDSVAAASIRVAGVKWNANLETDHESDVVNNIVEVKKELMDDYVFVSPEAMAAYGPGTSSSSALGSWTISGFDPAYYFPPELSIRVRHVDTQPASLLPLPSGSRRSAPPLAHSPCALVNTTPPLVCQGDTLHVELWSFWMMEGTSFDLAVTDVDGCDVSQALAAIHVVVPEEEPVTMDKMNPQCVCTFAVHFRDAKDAMGGDDLSEVLLEIRLSNQRFRVPLSGTDATRASLRSCETPGDETGGTVRSTCRSRSIFIRSAEAANAERMLDHDSLSYQYWVRNLLAPNEKITGGGFTDPGRSNTLLKDVRYYDILNSSDGDREVIVVEKDDARLEHLLKVASDIVDRICDTAAKAAALMWFVDAVMSGGDRTEAFLRQRLALDSGRGCQPTASASTDVGSHPARAGDGTRPSRGTKRTRRCTTDATSKRRRRQAGEPEDSTDRPWSCVWKLGDVTNGLCRHRSLLFKYLCDALRIPCYLVRGEHRDEASVVSNEGERHTWNVVVLGDRMLLADTTLSPYALLPWPDSRYSGYASLTSDSASSLRSVVSLKPNHAGKPVTVLEECGKGSSASVRRCSVGGLTCVIKLPRCEKDQSALQVEYQTLRLFEGVPHVVQSFGWYKGGILLEFYPLSLLSFMNMLLLRRSRLGQNQIRQVVVGICHTLVHVHAKRLVHRDVKAENVLVNIQRCRSCLQYGTVCSECSMSQVALADFADVWRFPDGPYASADVTHQCLRVGTQPYAAPEVEFELPFSFQADMWSLGVLAVEMSLMQLPVDKKACPSGRSTLMPTLDGPKAVFVPAVGPREPSWLQEVSRACCVVDWRQRATSTRIMELLANEKDCTVKGHNAQTEA